MVNKKTFIYVVAGMVLLMLTMYVMGYHHGKRQADNNIKADTSYVVTSDYKSPSPINEVGVGNVSVPLAVFPASKENEKHRDEHTDTILRVYLPDTGRFDTMRVNIPITQKKYRDSDYTVYVSGYMPKLDSIQIKSRVITYTKSVTKYRKWNVGLTGGYGYGFFSHRLEPFVGIGLTWNLFR